MTDPTDDGLTEAQGAGPTAPRARNQLSKVLPTDRLSIGKQLLILRAYPAASGDERQAVSNNQVASAGGDLVPSSVSLVNPFLVSVGLLHREGSKQRPSDALFDYLHAYQWSAETAGAKLYPAFVESWAAKALLPKLTLRQLSKKEAVQTLADDSKATRNDEKKLEALLEFLNVAGVIRFDGNSVAKGQAPGDEKESGQEVEDVDTDKEKGVTNGGKARQVAPPPPEDVHRFEIPIPGKPSVVIHVPKSLDADDWAMFQQMFGIYVKRWKGFEDTTTKGSGGQPDGGAG
jgi:hypothetical protein